MPPPKRPSPSRKEPSALFEASDPAAEVSGEGTASATEAVAPQGVSAELRVEGGRHDGKVVKLGAGTCVIGRSSKCDLSLKKCAGVSRRHCKIQFVADPKGPGSFVVFDLESRNGTYVNGESQPRRVLKDGDVVEISDERVRFVVTGKRGKKAASQEAPTALFDAETKGPPPLPRRRPPVVIDDEPSSEDSEPVPAAPVSEEPPPLDVTKPLLPRADTLEAPSAEEEEPAPPPPRRRPPPPPRDTGTSYVPGRRKKRSVGGLFVLGGALGLVAAVGATFAWDAIENGGAWRAALFGGGEATVTTRTGDDVPEDVPVKPGDDMAVRPGDAAPADDGPKADAGAAAPAPTTEAAAPTPVAAAPTTEVAAPTTPPAVVAPASLVEVRFPAGGRIQSVAVAAGDAVLAGAVLFVIEAPGASSKKLAALRDEERDFAAAAAQGNKAAQRDLEEVRARLREMEAATRPVTVKAPVAGVVVDLGAVVGGTAKAKELALTLRPR